MNRVMRITRAPRQRYVLNKRERRKRNKIETKKNNSFYMYVSFIGLRLT